MTPPPTAPIPDPKPSRSPNFVVWMVVGVLAVVLWQTSASREVDSIETHRRVVENCWDAVESKLPTQRSRTEQIQTCERMERGFKQMYGSGF
ncbi:hypothetical protein GT347_03255 [Xylophilus rhododendri]|uniref:Uncharacterized protein n=1 Tax=Xylophilus rhododendri TaxID=2697032 RepID=A0A857J035_9BURK|nr:hypothetical protein [Xylophilus rhododendri]QHI97086.1 hypothetical protein GT347_03255 [Xylophilus rhododendri]